MPDSGSIGARIEASWLRLSPNARGLIWVTAGTVIFAFNDVAVKITGATVHAAEMAWFRYLIGLILLSPIFMRVGWQGLRTEKLKLHLGRALLAGIGQAGAFYAVTHLILADAVALSFTRPLFMTVLAVFFLSELVGMRRWLATAVGFIGVLVVARPGQGAIDPAAVVAVVSACLFAFGLIIVRRLARTDSPTQILFYYHLFGVALFTGPTIWVWKTPAEAELLGLLAIGMLTCAAMVCFIRGYAIGEASILGPIEYVRLVYAAALGFLIFTEIPDLWTWTGSAIIVASTVYIARHEAAAKRTSRRAAGRTSGGAAGRTRDGTE